MAKSTGRKRLIKRQQTAVSGRLRDWFTRIRPCLKADGSLNVTKIAERIGTPRMTVDGWFREGPEGRSHAPELFHVFLLADQEGVNPSWLLLGVGPERLLTSRSESDVADEFRARVLEEVFTRYPSVAPTLVDLSVPIASDLLRGAVAAASRVAVADLERRRRAVLATDLLARLKRSPREMTLDQLRMAWDAAGQAAERIVHVDAETQRLATETWRQQVDHEISRMTVQSAPPEGERPES